MIKVGSLDTAESFVLGINSEEEFFGSKKHIK